MAHRRLAGLTAAIVSVACLLLATAAAANPDQWKREGWTKTDFSKSSIAFEDILSGGPPKDGIPSIDDPEFADASAVDDLGEMEPVITVAINGDARAYPLRILIWHEIVNDEVGGKPVAVTYCPLCNSAIVFSRRVNSRVLDFGTTGKLRNSDLVMYDRQTESWWQQFTGTGIVGELTGVELETIPARVESFTRFKARFPAGKVLVPNSPMRPYGSNPYVNYDSRSAPYPFFTGEMPEGINPMARVVAFEAEDGKHAVDLALLRTRGSVTVGDVTLHWEAGQNSALDTAQISRGRDVGNITARRDGADAVYDVTFAFVFNAFYPDRPIKTE